MVMQADMLVLTGLTSYSEGKKKKAENYRLRLTDKRSRENRSATRWKGKHRRETPTSQ